MRDLCATTTTSAMNGKKGAAVAAAVAFLERQQQQKSKPMLHQQTTDKNVKIAVARDNITVASNENCEDANKLLNGVAPTMSAVAEKRKKFDANRPKVFARQTSENSENRISNVEKTLPRSDDDHVNTFEGAVLDFDLTAEDVQKFVAESMRKIESATQGNTSPGVKIICKAIYLYRSTRLYDCLHYIGVCSI